jgi:hypothetical protein
MKTSPERRDANMHRFLIAVATIALSGLGAAISFAADARGYRGHGGVHGGVHSGVHRHGGARVGVYLGFPLYAPFYYPGAYYPPYPYYPYPPAGYVPPAAPPVYVERRDALPLEEELPQAAPGAAQSAPAAYWYFCPDSNTYYPYVKECPSEWLRVVPQPPSVGR